MLMGFSSSGESSQAGSQPQRSSTARCLNLAVGGLASLLLLFSAVMILVGVPEMWSIPIVMAGLGFAMVLARPTGGLWQRLHLITSFVAIALMLAFVLVFIYFFFAILSGGD